MDLATWQLGGRHDGPHVLITAGVHGDEFEPMAALRRLRGRLLGQEVRGRIILVPVVNEPAFRLGRRTADDGMDLARPQLEIDAAERLGRAKALGDAGHTQAGWFGHDAPRPVNGPPNA